MPAESSKPDRWEKEESRILLRDVFYVILILWVSVFVAESFFLNKQSTTFDRIFGYIIVFIPLGTLNFFLHYLYRNRRIRRTGKLRSSLRYRLILAFLIVSIIPSLPIFLLSSGRVESVIAVFFDLDFRGAIDSAEHLMNEWEAEASKIFFQSVRSKRTQLIATFMADAGGRFDPQMFDGLLREKFDSVYLVDRGSPVLLYGQSLRTDELFENPTPVKVDDDGYGLVTVDQKRYAFASLTVRPETEMILTRRLYPNRAADEKKYRDVSRLLNVDEARWEKVIPYSLRLSLAILYLGMIVADILIALLIARQVSHPIVSLAAATRAVTEGNLDTRIDLRAEGEIGILIESFNSMTEELQTLRSRLLHSLRVGAWQEVARRLAHEIKNPLTPIQLSSERMLRKLDKKGQSRDDLDQVVRTGANTIIEQVNVLKHLLEEFSNFARLPSRRLELIQIGPLVQESAELFRNIDDVSVEVRVMDNLPLVWIDKTLFIGMMNNLIKNAVEAVHEKFQDDTVEHSDSKPTGRIVISTVLHRQAGRRFVLLKIEDNGIGIPEQMRDSIFEPYFSTKGDHGNGLGLALVERAVMEHNARIYVSRSALGGAEFRVLFPEGKSA